MAEAPYLPRCSSDKTAVLVRPVEYAIRYPYMQVNRQGMVSWLVFDLDHGNAVIWDDVGLPEPNMIVKNPKNGHSHLFYAIRPVCTTEFARSKPIQYMKAIYASMAARMNADSAYSGPVAKTPGHPFWRTSELHNHVYDLNELADFVELPQSLPWSKGPDFDAVSHSRHCLLFEEVRFYAYSIVNREREQGSYLSFYNLVEAFAINCNNYGKRGFSDGNLRLSQVNATVKSIARWTWDKYRGSSTHNRGCMRLVGRSDLSLGQKQKLAAEHAHKARRRTTESKVRLACHALLNAGKKLTHVAIADHAGLSRQTVSKYQDAIAAVLTQFNSQSNNVVDIKAHSIRSNVNVKYGQHQITAARRARAVVLKKVIRMVSGGVDGCLYRGKPYEKKNKEIELLLSPPLEPEP